MKEAKILDETLSLCKMAKDTLFNTRCTFTITRGPNGEIWRNYKTTYSCVDAGEFGNKLKAAMKRMKFNPPIGPPE